MTSAQHQRWNRSGLQWRLGEPWHKLRDLLRSKGYTVYDIGNDSHMDHQPPEDHTPYSETNWPGGQQYGVVMALDIMPGGGPASLQWLGRQFAVDRNNGRFPFLKYMNWGPSDNNHAIQSRWMPDYSERPSSDTGHIHLSFRTDYVNWDGSYDPFGGTMATLGMNDSDYPNVGRPSGLPKRSTAELVADIAGEILLGSSPYVSGAPRWMGKQLQNISDKLDALAARPLLTDAQISELAQELHAAQDANQDEFTVTAVETALRNVLRKGVDNAG